MMFSLRSLGWFLAAAVFFFTCPPTGQTAIPASDPLVQVKQEVQEVVAVFQDQSMSLQARREKLRQMSNQYFDFTDMARSALGYQWRKLTPQQRDEFVPVFATFIQNAYLSKLQDYSVQKIREEARTASINFTGEKFDGPDYAEVQSNIVLVDQKDPIQVNYLMHRTPDGWRIYDLTILGISVIANYRNQFRRVINDKGYDQLVSDLKLKRQQLQEYMDHPRTAPTPG
jgi:phospholipid transport system substrate-binding protein